MKSDVFVALYHCESCQAHNRELDSPVVVRDVPEWWSPVLFREVTDASCQE